VDRSPQKEAAAPMTPPPFLKHYDSRLRRIKKGFIEFSAPSDTRETEEGGAHDGAFLFDQADQGYYNYKDKEDIDRYIDTQGHPKFTRCPASVLLQASNTEKVLAFTIGPMKEYATTAVAAPWPDITSNLASFTWVSSLDPDTALTRFIPNRVILDVRQPFQFMHLLYDYLHIMIVSDTINVRVSATFKVEVLTKDVIRSLEVLIKRRGKKRRGDDNELRYHMRHVQEWIHANYTQRSLESQMDITFYCAVHV